MKNKKAIIYLVAALIVSFAGIYAFTISGSHQLSLSSAYSSKSDTTTSNTYTCPMHPEVISDKPGQCPKCGMDLELKEENGTKDDGTKNDGMNDNMKKDEKMDHSNCSGCKHKH